MTDREAAELIEKAVSGPWSSWADLGCGDGTFTRAIARLIGPRGRIYAVDRNPRAVAGVRRWAREDPRVIPVVADFTRSLDLPGLEGTPLDGILFANALHFVSDPDVVLARLAALLRPGGRIVIVEYDRRGASPWVPHPIPLARLPAVLAGAGLPAPVITASRPSAFGGTLYVAAVDRDGRR